MNLVQRISLLLGGTVLALLMLHPPWQEVLWGLGPYRIENLGHLPVWDQPPFSQDLSTGDIVRIRRVHMKQWTLEIFGILALTAGLLWAFKTNPHAKNPFSR